MERTRSIKIIYEKDTNKGPIKKEFTSSVDVVNFLKSTDEYESEILTDVSVTFHFKVDSKDKDDINNMLNGLEYDFVTQPSDPVDIIEIEIQDWQIELP